MTWDELERKPGNASEAERLEGQNKEAQFNKDLAKTFSSDSGMKVLERWKKGTVEKRIDMVLTNPHTGVKYPQPAEAIFARVGEENFIKDIIKRIERAKNI